MNKNTVGIGLEALNTRLLRLTEMIQEASKFPNRSSRTRPSYSLEELEEQLHCFLKDEVLPFKGNTDSQFWFF